MKKLIIAHRGASKEAPENTLAAFKKAIELGADMIELDIRKAADGSLVVHHDPKIGGQKISWLSLGEIRKLGPSVPTLLQALKLVSGKIKLDIELKERGLEEEVIRLARKYLKPEDFIISSFYGSVIKKAKRFDPRVTTGLIIGIARPFDQLKFLKLMALRLASKADILILHHLIWKAEFSKFFPHHKQLIYIWTVDEEAQIKKLLAHRQIAGVITNNPRLAIGLRK